MVPVLQKNGLYSFRWTSGSATAASSGAPCPVVLSRGLTRPWSSETEGKSSWIFFGNYERLAKDKLPKMVYDYFASGSKVQWMLRENREAFSRILRDRVKCKRAVAKKESKIESIRGAAERHKGEPDLIELSKGLPSECRAYIEESTKQVYYGNNLTFETTWDRPSK